MLSDLQLQDYGLILLALAAFGFIVSDAFKMGRSWGIPVYRNDIETVFHYISNAITAIVLSFVVVLYFVINYPKHLLIVYFTSYIQKVGITENILLGLFWFTLFYSVLYMSVFLAGAYLFVIFHYIKALYINVYLIGKRKPETFAGIITESKDFFFFQKDDIALWEAIKKDQIVRMETIKDKSKIYEVWPRFHSKFNENLHNIYSGLTEDLHNLWSTIKTFVYRKK